MITGEYKKLYDELLSVIPKERMFHDALYTLAYGTDASFYRLVPKLVVRVHNEEEVRALLQSAHHLSIPVTFRAAGTSLSGQAVSDSVLVVASHGWDGWKVLEGGRKIQLQPGVRGAMANRYLAPYGRKIGPDPASIDSAMIGGILANNASGMCCGTSDNSYKTVADVRVILADGTLLDTADPASREAFCRSHKHFLMKLEDIASYIAADVKLKEKIKRKYKIKNTIGYSLNAFVDYYDGIEILKHLIVGSEGTLAFISSVTYNTVADCRDKALAMIVYRDIESACRAVQKLKAGGLASAVEFIDRAGVRSVGKTPGIPSFLRTIGDESCVILVEARAESDEKLDEKLVEIKSSLEGIDTEFPFEFTKDSREQSVLWKLRKELYPSIAGLRRSGTTAIIEDVCFPVEKLAEAVLSLRAVLEKDGYGDAVVYGHALEGNLHFVFNQDFSTPESVEKYRILMQDMAELVVGKYDGSLKAEHGTGRNMAPYVEMEWGRTAYRLMKDIKEIFDPKGILNPGVIINSDPAVHISNLKLTHSTRETVDKCMECGFCESHCVSDGLTLSPRQRVAAFREMERLKASGEEPHRAAEMQHFYKYAGEQTCATDSLCYLACPVKTDAGKLIKELRHEGHRPSGEKRAVRISERMNTVTSVLRVFLKIINAIRSVTGKLLFGIVARTLRWTSFKTIPLWNENMPTGASKIGMPDNTVEDDNRPAVVYFPSCVTRTMGTSKSYSKEKEVTVMTAALIEAAGYRIVYPENMNKLCCGMLFSSKGYVEAGKNASDKLKEALMKASDGGTLPILCDMSPCLYTMKSNFGDTLKLYEPAEFIDKYLIDKLDITPVDEKVAVFPVCSARKMEVDGTLVSVARRCAREVEVMDSNCCGFAGDRGFIVPELNDHGLRRLKEQAKGCDEGFSTSRTCEIGLSTHSGIVFKSIVYLVARAAGVSTAKK